MTDEDPEVIDTTKLLVRQLVWDLTPDDEVPAVAEAMGLIPCSPEVDARNHIMSHVRVQRVMPLNVPVMVLTKHIGEIVTEAMLLGTKPTAQERSTTLEKQTLIIRNSVVAALASLIDMGAITYGPGVSR